MFCPNCGNEINDAAVMCVNCGATVTPKAQAPQQTYQQNYQQQGYQQAPQQGYYQQPQQPYGQAPYQQPYNAAQDVPSTLFKVLSFFFPIVGIILYFVKKDQEPVSAKAYLKMAIIAIIISVVVSIVSSIVSTIVGMSYYY